jgi:hypothetical protein
LVCCQPVDGHPIVLGNGNAVDFSGFGHHSGFARHRRELFDRLRNHLWFADQAITHRNDKGESFAERGVDTIPLSFKKRQVIRFLSLVGATNALYLGLVMIPQAYIGMYSAPWPASVVNTPYRNDGICGLGTDYVRPNSKFPIQMEGRDHISFKDGSLTRSLTPSFGTLTTVSSTPTRNAWPPCWSSSRARVTLRPTGRTHPAGLSSAPARVRLTVRGLFAHNQHRLTAKSRLDRSRTADTGD